MRTSRCPPWGPALGGLPDVRRDGNNHAALSTYETIRYEYAVLGGNGALPASAELSRECPPLFHRLECHRDSSHGPPSFRRPLSRRRADTIDAMTRERGGVVVEYLPSRRMSAMESSTCWARARSAGGRCDGVQDAFGGGGRSIDVCHGCAGGIWSTISAKALTWPPKSFPSRSTVSTLISAPVPLSITIRST